jgi:hypothetical protein
MNYCPGCALEMRRLRFWCPCRRRLSVGWLHVLLVAAVDAACVIGLLG